MNSSYPARLPDLPDGVIIPSALAEADGLAVLAALAHRFGWTYAIWNHATLTRVLEDLDRPIPPRKSSHQDRQLTDEEWGRLTQTDTWRQTIPDVAIDRVAGEDLLEQAAVEAGLACAQCRIALTDPPGITGRLCQAHRTGPAGQPAVVNPATEGLYWLESDTLFYAPIDWEHKLPGRDAGTPVEWDRLDRPDPLARQQAQQADAALRVLPAPAHTRDNSRSVHARTAETR